MEEHPQDNEMQELLRAVDEKYQQDVSSLESRIERYDRLVQGLEQQVTALKRELDSFSNTQGRTSIPKTQGRRFWEIVKLILRVLLIFVAFIIFNIAGSMIANAVGLARYEPYQIVGLFVLFLFCFLILFRSGTVSLSFNFRQDYSKNKGSKE